MLLGFAPTSGIPPPSQARWDDAPGPQPSPGMLRQAAAAGGELLFAPAEGCWSGSGF